MGESEVTSRWRNLAPDERRKSNPFRFWLECYVALQKTSVAPEWVKQYDRMYCQHRGGMLAAAMFEYLDNPPTTYSHGWYQGTKYSTPSKGKTPHRITLRGGDIGAETNLDILWSPREPATFRIKVLQEEIKVKKRVPFMAEYHGGKVTAAATEAITCWLPAMSCELTVEPSDFYPGDLTPGMDPRHYLLSYPPSRRVISLVEGAIQEERLEDIPDDVDPEKIWRHFKG